MGGYETDGIDDGDALLVGFDDGMLDIVGPIVGSGEGEELGSFVVETIGVTGTVVSTVAVLLGILFRFC